MQYTEQQFDQAMKTLLEAKLQINYWRATGEWYWSSRNDAESLDDWQGPFTSYFKALADAIEPYNPIRTPKLENEYISQDQATHFRVFEDFDGWAIDAADSNGNYSEHTWTHYDGEPLTKEMAINKVKEFAEEYGRSDIANKYEVIDQ